MDHEVDQKPDRKSAAAEAEPVYIWRRNVGFRRDAIRIGIISTGELIEVEHVALQPDAERSFYDRPVFESGRPDAIVIGANLIRTGKIKGLIKTPHIGLLGFGGTVARAVRAENDSLRGQ
nr:hypothetical protein [Methylocystis sp.]